MKSFGSELLFGYGTEYFIFRCFLIDFVPTYDMYYDCFLALSYQLCSNYCSMFDQVSLIFADRKSVV